MDDVLKILTDQTLWGVEARKMNTNFDKLWAAIMSLAPAGTSNVKSVNGVLPDSQGNIKITAQSVSAISSDLLGVKNGVPQLDQNGLIKQANLEDRLRSGVLYEGLAIPSLSPVKGLYFTVTEGSYVNFRGSDSLPLRVTADEVKQNLVILSNIGSYWEKVLIPYPSQQAPSLDVYWNDIKEKPDFAEVAMSGKFSDLSDVPDFIKTEQIGRPNGVASLQQDGTIPSYQLPATLSNGEVAAFGRLVTPASDPTSIISQTSMQVWFLPTAPGTYTNFGGIVITDDELYDAILFIVHDSSGFTKLTYKYPIKDVAAVTSVNGQTGSVNLTAADIEAIPATLIGAINGVAPLSAAGKIDTQYLPASQTDFSNKPFNGIATTETEFGVDDPGLWLLSVPGDYQANEAYLVPGETEDDEPHYEYKAVSLTTKDLIDYVNIAVEESKDSNTVKLYRFPLTCLVSLFNFNESQAVEQQVPENTEVETAFDALTIHQFKTEFKPFFQLAPFYEDAPDLIKAEEGNISLGSWIGLITAYLKAINIKEIAKLPPRVDALETGLEEANTKIETLESELSEANSKISNLNADLSSANTKIGSLETKVSSLESSNSQLLSDVSTLQSQAQDLISRVEALEQRI